MEKFDRRAQIVVSHEWEARLEEWRRKQPRLMNKSEAIRQIVDERIAADAPHSAKSLSRQR